MNKLYLHSQELNTRRSVVEQTDCVYMMTTVGRRTATVVIDLKEEED